MSRPSILSSGARPSTISEAIPRVLVVDDDVSVRESLELLICSAGWVPETYACAAAFLARPTVAAPSCVVLDLSLPDGDGLDLQERLAGDRAGPPIVFLTGYGDVPKTVRAMKGGAFEFLVKPVRDDVLLATISCAIERSDAELRRDADSRMLRECHASLTSREREVFSLVVAGRMNKQIAADLAISEVTVKAHRGKVMRKMGARSLADLVKMAAKLGVSA